jgi:hypothetical protein
VAVLAKALDACPKCEKFEMTFKTAQLRGADEGQTIFFTCGNCAYVQPESTHVHSAIFDFVARRRFRRFSVVIFAGRP